MIPTSELPPPAAEALALSRRLAARIQEEIAERGGRIGFARYMELALYEPGLGYYSAGSVKLGREGDFITAPEVSPLFGRCLARQIHQVLATVGGGEVLEFGAGSGRLAADALLELERLGTLPEKYLVLEISADLRERQRRFLEGRIPHLLPRVQWLDTLPVSMRGVILANEVLDAMPVARFRRAEEGVAELCVGSSDGGFQWAAVPIEASSALAVAIARIHGECDGWPWGYTSEVNLGLAPWFTSLAELLDRGAVLLVDYGYPRREYYHPQRAEGTLLCHYRHRAHGDPFLWPGLQDITASVDFTAAAEAAHEAGLAVAGYTTQAHFLLCLGLTELYAEAVRVEPQRELEFSGQVKRLTLPGEMGERFKVLALTRAIETSLQGFALSNQLGRL